MQVSVIIPTYYRRRDVDECLDSINAQTELPKEVIVIDNTKEDIETENLIEERKNEFKENSIFLKYIRNERENSLAIARNIGIENAIGDIILFLDDDVILDKDYIKEILRIYEEYPNALGVQGYITNLILSKFWNKINKILLLGCLENNKCRVLPSTNTTYPYLLDKVISCQWLSGANHSYKRDVLQNFKYDENLKGYSYTEDIDVSYQIYKKEPNSLYITPHARLIHKTSQEGRLPNKILIYMKQIYAFYFFYKNMDQNFKNKLIFLWSRFISPIMYTGSLLLKHKLSYSSFIYLINAYIICMKHKKEIKKGDLEFFNKELR